MPFASLVLLSNLHWKRSEGPTPTNVAACRSFFLDDSSPLSQLGGNTRVRRLLLWGRGGVSRIQRNDGGVPGGSGVVLPAEKIDLF